MSPSAVQSDLAPSLRALAESSPPVAVPPDARTIEQNSEWFLVKYDGAWRELRLHDYPDIYSIRGLYERIVYDVLRCRSPEVIRDELIGAVRQAGGDPSGLTVLDLGSSLPVLTWPHVDEQDLHAGGRPGGSGQIPRYRSARRRVGDGA